MIDPGIFDALVYDMPIFLCYLFDAQSPIILQHEVLVRFIFGKLKFKIVKCSLCWKYLSILQTLYS